MTTKPRETQIEDLIQRWREEAAPTRWRNQDYGWDWRMQIKACADQLEALLREEAWQPIETAPKEHGRNLLIWCDSNRCTYTASWDGEGWNHFASCGASERVQHNVTHWMPLPAAPKAGEE